MSTTTSTVDDVTTVITTGIANKAKWYDILERVVWTLLQVTTGEILRNLLNGAFVRYNVLNNGAVLQLGIEWIIVFTFVITVAKNIIASRLGNGTASTLPKEYEPVLPGTVTTTTTVDTTPAPVVEVPAPVEAPVTPVVE
jgi:hypothetical protein